MPLQESDIAQLRTRALPFCADGDMVFTEPWEAKAFAIVVTLSNNGFFTWSEWVDCFSEHVAAATRVEVSGGTPKKYYEQWVDAAEELLVAKGLTSTEQLFAKRFGALAPSMSHAKTR